MKLFNRAAKNIPIVPRKEGTDELLRRLCGSDAMLYEAMSNFLLVDPRAQELAVGGVNLLQENGMKAMQDGDNLRARVEFEIAARLALYHFDRVNVEKLLKLADQLSEGKNRHSIHEILLSNLDRALDIADQYYSRVYGADEQIKEARRVEQPAQIPVSK